MIIFDLLDFSADSFIINCTLKIYIWFFYTLMFVVFFLLRKKVNMLLKERIMNAFLFSSTISLFMCCLMPFGFASFIEIQNIRKTLPFKMVSVCASFFILATLFFFLYSLTLISIKGTQHYHNERFLKQYLSVLKPFKNKPICLFYYPIYCWKRFAMIIVTASFLS